MPALVVRGQQEGYDEGVKKTLAGARVETLGEDVVSDHVVKLFSTPQVFTHPDGHRPIPTRPTDQAALIDKILGFILESAQLPPVVRDSVDESSASKPLWRVADGAGWPCGSGWVLRSGWACGGAEEGERVANGIGAPPASANVHTAPSAALSDAMSTRPAWSSGSGCSVPRAFGSLAREQPSGPVSGYVWLCVCMCMSCRRRTGSRVSPTDLALSVAVVGRRRTFHINAQGLRPLALPIASFRRHSPHKRTHSGVLIRRSLQRVLGAACVRLWRRHCEQHGVVQSSEARR